LLKNPANGGIPAVENKRNENEKAIQKLGLDNDNQFIKNLGALLLILESNTNEKIASVIMA